LNIDLLKERTQVFIHKGNSLLKLNEIKIPIKKWEIELREHYNLQTVGGKTQAENF
jgi:hypothetical protein